jgi:hypothetical protein
MRTMGAGGFYVSRHDAQESNLLSCEGVNSAGLEGIGGLYG